MAGAGVAQPQQFPVAEARFEVLADDQYFDGVVEAVHKSTISAQTEGEIIELPFDVNDYVPKGSIVIRFEDTKQKARLDKAVASEAQVQARLVEAESRYRRNQRLVKDNAVSQSELEKSEADLKAAKAQLELSRAALKEAREQWEYTVVRAPYAGVLTERFVEVGEHAQVRRIAELEFPAGSPERSPVRRGPESSGGDSGGAQRSGREKGSAIHGAVFVGT